jgi:hypothetical protein
LQLINPSTSPNELNTTLTPHSIIHGHACFAYFNKIWGIPPMNSMRRDDVTWIVVVTLIAVTINPMLKFIGLLPADVFRNLGISFPGQPQIVFGPLMASGCPRFC